jgi:MFS family permease
MIAVEPPKGEATPVSRYAWYALGVMMLVHMLSIVDRQILSILAEQIKADLKLTDAQLGFLFGTAFAVFYTLFGIPMGRLADSWYRTRLMAIGLALWSLMTALSGFASSYALLTIARLGVGVGEASASPAAVSMQADYFPKRVRGRANAVYSCGAFLGAGLSLPLGGSIAQGWNNAFGDNGPLGLVGWQAAFIVVGLPGLLVAAWVWSLKEPQRLGARGEPVQVSHAGAWRGFANEVMAIVPPFTLWSVSRYRGELRRNLLILAGVASVMTLLIASTGDVAQWVIFGAAIYAVASWVQTLRYKDAPTFRLIWGTREVILLLLGFGSLAVLTYSLTFWAAPYAIRTYHVSAATAGLAIGLPTAAAAAGGILAGGWLTDAWRRRDARGRIFTPMIAPIITAPLVVIQYFAPDFTTFALLNAAVCASTNMWAGAALAANQDLVLPRMTGTISATHIMANTLLGACIGPYGTGKVATITGDLRLGVYSCLVFAPVALLCLWLVSRKVGELEQTKAERARQAGEPTDPILSDAAFAAP